MVKGKSFAAEQESGERQPLHHNLGLPVGESEEHKQFVTECDTYIVGPEQCSAAEQECGEMQPTSHHLGLPAGESEEHNQFLTEYQTYTLCPGQCSAADQESGKMQPTGHHHGLPAGHSEEQMQFVTEYHTYTLCPGECCAGEQVPEEMQPMSAQLGLPVGEFEELKPFVAEHHTYTVGPGRCSSVLAQRIDAPLDEVWPVVRRFDKPQAFKFFISRCFVEEGSEITVGCTRELDIVSGLPASTSKERLDLLDDDRHITGFSIVGGEHRLQNFRSMTTLHGFEEDGKIWTVVLVSYIVDVPEGNTEEDTRLFADTIVRLNLRKLVSVVDERMNGDGDGESQQGPPPE